MSVYSDPEVRSDFEIVYKRTGKKLDMGGCCVTSRRSTICRLTSSATPQLVAVHNFFITEPHASLAIA
jgi:hypothetical protein